MAASLQFEGRDITANVSVDFSQEYIAGGYSDVFRGTLAVDDTAESLLVAVKMPRNPAGNIDAILRILKEIQAELSLWGRLVHPNIVPLLGLYWRNDHGPTFLPGAVSPWCNDGTIVEYVRNTREARAPGIPGPVEDDFDLLCFEVELLSQAANGLAYLHGTNIVHGDVKGSNILIHNGIARLGDFGYSVVLAERSGTTSAHLGTHRWFAPESLSRGAHRTREADMWAFACVILEVRTLELPYHDRENFTVSTALRDGDLPYAYPPNMNTELWEIATECWDQLTEPRPTAKEVSARLEDLLFSLRAVYEELSSLHNRQPIELAHRISESIALSVFLSLVDQTTHSPQAVGSESALLLASVLKVLDALEILGERYPRTLVQRLALWLVPRDIELAKQVMTKFSSPELFPPLRGHLLSVESIAFLPDGDRLVSSSEDATLRIWDIALGKTVIGPLRGHTDTVSGVAVSGSRIVSCSYDGTFRVWDASSGNRVIGPIIAHERKAVNCVAYSRDGTHIATGGGDNRTALFDARTGLELRKMDGHTAPVMSVAFSSDGLRLVSGSWDATICIWDVASGDRIGEPMISGSWVHVVAFTPDGKRIFSSSGDKTIQIWDAETGNPAVEPLEVDDTAYSMALSPDGKRLVAGFDGGGIALWDAETATAIPVPFRDQRQQVWGVAFSPDGKMIASASQIRTIALWDATEEWQHYDVDKLDLTKHVD